MPHTSELHQVENGGDNGTWDARVLVCRNGHLVNTFIVVTERFVLLVDTVINPRTSAQMLEWARPHLKNGRQLLVINTHADYDHCWGNQLFAGETAVQPAPIIGSHLSPAKFLDAEAHGFLAKMKLQEPDIFREVVFTPPTLLIRDKFVIDGGDLTVELLPTPGHTDDHYSLYLPEAKTILAGDAAELPYPAPRTPEGLPAMRASLARLAALPADVVLYCHAPVTAGRQLLLDNIKYFNTIETRCRAALARGSPPPLHGDADHPGRHVATDTEVIAFAECPYEACVPSAPTWQDVSDFYRTAGHAAQIRAMLKWLLESDSD